MKKTLILIASSLVCFNLSLSAGDSDVKANWDRHCAKCHAEDGSASTKLGERLEIMDYTKPESLAKFSDKELFDMTKDGVEKTKMRGYGSKLSDEEIHDLVAYMRAMSE